jgi:enoyl-CoA hydratase
MLNITTQSGTTTIQLAHGKASALDVELVKALDEAIRTAEKDDATRAVVLTGSGKIFCAGVDLHRVVKEGASYGERFLPALSAMFLRLFSFPKPVVAAVNGHAIAGGCVIACAADYRIMANTNGTIGVPELKVGVPFPLVAIEILRFAVTSGHLQELVYVGKTYTPAAAAEHRLIDEVVEPAAMAGRAREIAERLATEPVARFRITKQQLRRPVLDAIARHDDETAGAVIRGWQDPATLAAIDAYIKATLR